MVQGKMVKISYKSDKCLRQPRENWIIVEDTHEPIIDKETFRKVRLLMDSRKHTRSRTYDYLLKGLVFCHECGYPLATINRPPVSGEDRLFFICRTYQRFTKAGVCTCHSIKEKDVTDAVLAKVRQICEAYLDMDELLPVAQEAIRDEETENSHVLEMRRILSKIESMTANLDRMYMDKLAGILAESDFQRIYQNVKEDRSKLEGRLKELQEQIEQPMKPEVKAKELVQRFLENACVSKELLFSLIERIELSEEKHVYIKFRFRELDDILMQSGT